MINWIQGSGKKMRIHLLDPETRDPIDLTGAVYLEVCFPAAAADAPADLYNSIVSGTTANGNATITGLADTSKIQEGMSVTGTGVAPNSKVLKTPESAESPTAAGEVLLSINATASGTVPITFYNVEIENAEPEKGVLLALAAEVHSWLAKTGNAQTIEATYQRAGEEKQKVQITGVLNVIKSVCPKP